MIAFDIRVTGELDGEHHHAEADEQAAKIAVRAVGALNAAGLRIHGVMLNGRELCVTIDKVEVAAKDPDRWIVGMTQVLNDRALTPVGGDNKEGV
jgi:hypothetical protein